MDTLTRRKFLIASGVTAGGALAAGVTALSLGDLLATAPDADPTAGTLVVVTLYGGADGLNTVVPYADPAYRAARPELAYDAGQVLPLDAVAGLNPALAGLHRWYQGQKLAIVRGVGYPRPNRSHFVSMDIWHTAQPDRPGTTGWLGRWLDTVGGDPRLAVSFEPVLPPLLAGATSAGAAVPLTGLKLPRGVPEGAVVALGRTADGESPLRARAATCFAQLRQVDEMVSGVPDGPGDEDDDDNEDQGTGTGGRTALRAQLDLVARCVEAGVATRAYSVSLGGFDTHAAEKPALERLLGELDRALTGFLERMERTENGRRVTVLVYSEFGRRVRANASDGTDHGTASHVFLAGAGVRPGLHGEPPSLTDLDRGDLKYTMDFRDVYAVLLDRVLGAEPERILSGWTGRAAGLVA